MNVNIRVPRGPERVEVLGVADRNLKMIREALGVNISEREGEVRIAGDSDAVSAARRVLERLEAAAARGEVMARKDVLGAIAEESVRAGHPLDTELLGDVPPEEREWNGSLNVFAGGRRIEPKSDNQRAYIDGIRNNDLVFCCGPAGSGKTYLAVAAAVHMLRIGRMKKLILARPAVEAGEKLGFLPGDMQAKVNPYLRPLFDALHDMMDYPTIKRFMMNDVVEVAPLAFLRGRTLNDAAIILDEAQNTTRGQMQMFLTRMGQRSKMIVTGDTTQVDLEEPEQSGLVDAIRRLRRTPGISFCTLEKSDIVRHDLVQRIVEAYGIEQREQQT